MKRFYFLFPVVLMILSCSVAFAQRPRITDPPPKTEEKTATTSEQKKDDATQKKDETQKEEAKTPTVQTVKVKYEGGVMGYRQKMDGYLFFDDVNSRLVFKDKQQKEIFSIPYDSVMSAFADTQSRRPTAATVIGSSVPYGLGLPALLIRKKYRYLTMQYNDPDVEASGITSFKVDTKEELEQALGTLVEKAKLTQRGEVFVKKRTASNTKTQGTN
jgi:hypothetical protein